MLAVAQKGTKEKPRHELADIFQHYGADYRHRVAILY